MKYEIIKRYDCKETTCGELVKILIDNNGDSFCLGISKVIDPVYPDVAVKLYEAWDWVLAGRKNKKVYLVIETESIGRTVKDIRKINNIFIGGYHNPHNILYPPIAILK